jgi:hypothetical protein
LASTEIKEYIDSMEFQDMVPFLLDDHNLSQRSKLLIDEEIVAPFVLNEIPINANLFLSLRLQSCSNKRRGVRANLRPRPYFCPSQAPRKIVVNNRTINKPRKRVVVDVII